MSIFVLQAEDHLFGKGITRFTSLTDPAPVVELMSYDIVPGDLPCFEVHVKVWTAIAPGAWNKIQAPFDPF